MKFPKPVIPAAKIARRVAELGRRISKDYAGRSLDVVIVLEDAFVFAADLVRQITARPVCHFVRSEVREVQFGGYDRREIFFSLQPDLQGKDVLLVDAVLSTGVTQDFLLRRFGEMGAQRVRLAVLIDRPRNRRVDVKPDYFGFQAASNYLVGYGLAGPDGVGRNFPGLNRLPGFPVSKRFRPAKAGKNKRGRRAGKGKG